MFVNGVNFDILGKKNECLILTLHAQRSDIFINREQRFMEPEITMIGIRTKDFVEQNYNM